MSFFHSWNCFRCCEAKCCFFPDTFWISMRIFFHTFLKKIWNTVKSRQCHNMMYWKDVLFLNEKGFEIIWIFHRWKTLKTWYFPRILCFQITYYPHSLHICLKTVFHNCWKLLIISKSLYFIDIFGCWQMCVSILHSGVFNIFQSYSQCGLIIHLLSTFWNLWKIVENSFIHNI